MKCLKCNTEFVGESCPHCGWRRIVLVLDTSAALSQSGMVPFLVNRNFVVKVPHRVFLEINVKKDHGDSVAKNCYRHLITEQYADVIERCTKDDIRMLPLEMKLAQGNTNPLHPVAVKLAIARRMTFNGDDVYFVTDDPVNRLYCNVLNIKVLSSEEARALRNIPAPNQAQPAPQAPSAADTLPSLPDVVSIDFPDLPAPEL